MVKFFALPAIVALALVVSGEFFQYLLRLRLFWFLASSELMDLNRFDRISAESFRIKSEKCKMSLQYNFLWMRNRKNAEKIDCWNYKMYYTRY